MSGAFKMKLIMENWNRYQDEAAANDLILEIVQISNEIIEYTSFLSERQQLDEAFLKKAAAWLGEKWKQLSSKADQLYQYSVEVFQKMGQIPAMAREAYLSAMIKIYLSLSNLMPDDPRRKFDKVLKAYSAALYNLCEEELGEAWQERIQDAVKEALEELMPNLAAEMPQDKAEQQAFLQQNGARIAEVIREAVLNSPDLKRVKEIIEAEASPEKLEKEFAAQLEASGLSLEAVKGFVVGGSFMFTFGIIDNLGLFIGMAAVEDYLQALGYPSDIAAGFGNTLSDALGVVLGGAVAAVLYKTLGVKGEGTYMQQLVMVIAGCLVPVLIKMLWYWLVANGFIPPD